MSIEHDVYRCFVPALVSVFWLLMRVQHTVEADYLKCVSRDPNLLYMLLGSPLAMSGWLVRSLLPVSASF